MVCACMHVHISVCVFVLKLACRCVCTCWAVHSCWCSSVGVCKLLSACL